MIIDRIKIKDNIATVIISNETVDIKYKVLLDDLIEMRIKEGDTISFEEQSELSHKHLMLYSLSKCMRKLASSDCTVKEITNVLKSIQDLSEEDIDLLIYKLTSLGFLSNKAVIEGQLYIDQKKLLGKKRTKQTLIKRGVDNETIDNYFDSIVDDEIERGVIKAELLLKKCDNKTYREKQNYIRKRLFEDGFEDIDSIIDRLVIDKDSQKEIKLLQALAEKVIKKYKKKSETNVKHKAFMYLLSKGFTSEDIKKVLNKMEDDYED